MAEFLIYQGKAAIALAVFYMFYRLLLSKETFHRFKFDFRLIRQADLSA